MTARTELPAPGTRMSFRWRKWDGSAHWVHDCVLLGSDRWGDWIGQRDGWHSARPGLEFDADGDSVTLLPPSGEYAATVNATHPRIAIYIDIAWEVGWGAGDGGLEPVGIDMDLDVVRAHDGRGIFIDDRDEWDEHRVRYGYPPEIVARLEQVAVELERDVTAERAPFDGATTAHWFTVLDRLAPRIEG